MKPETRTQTHHIYRCWNAAGDLLYIGCTSEVEKRFNYHRTQTQWWRDVARIETLEINLGRKIALGIEAMLIRDEQPLMNTLFNHKKGPIVPRSESEAIAELNGEATAFPTPPAVADRDRGPFVDAFLHELADDPRLDAIVAWAMAGGAK